MSQLSEEQRLMRQSCRDFVDDVVIPFIRGNWQREWVMTPENRLPPAGVCTSMKPPAPGPVSGDSATNDISTQATAASTAFPPARRTSAPACAVSG